MAYNTGAAGAVRVGNWQEELVLRDTTGIRFAPNPKDRQTSLLTKARVIDHTDRTEPKKFQSNVQSTIQDPRQHPDFVGSKKPAPRKMLMEARMRAQVEEEVKKKLDDAQTEKMRPEYDTINRSSFCKPENFSESMVLNNPDVKIQTKSKNYSVESATTYYGYAVEKGRGTLNFPVTYIQSTVHPFRRTNAFSADIRDPLLFRRVETNENYKVFPKVQDYRNLKAIKDKVVKNARGVPLHHIIVLLWSHEEVGETGVIALPLLCELLASYEPLQLSLTATEVSCLQNALCEAGSDKVSIVDFVNMLRGALTVHQQEIITLLFDKLDTMGKGFVTVEDVEGAYNRNVAGTHFTCPSTRAAGGGGNSRSMSASATGYVLVPDTLEQILENLQLTGGENARGTAELFDFVEYYWNISAVLDGNEVIFEQLIRAQWNLPL